MSVNLQNWHKAIMREEQNFSQKTYYVDRSHYAPLNSTMNLNGIYYYPYVRDAIGSLGSRWDQLYYNPSTRIAHDIEMKLDFSWTTAFPSPFPVLFCFLHSISPHTKVPISGSVSWEHNSRDFIDGITEPHIGWKLGKGNQYMKELGFKSQLF